MANRQRLDARRRAASKVSRTGATRWLPAVLTAVAVIVAAGGIVWAATGRDGAPAAANDGSAPGLAGLPSSQPVSVVGDSLPLYPSSGEADPAVGRRAPSLNGLDFNSQPVTVTPGAGPYMLVFVAHWCPHCNAEVARLLDWKQSGGVPEGLRVVAVSTAVSATGVNFPPAVWLASKGWTWPVLVDQAQGDGLAGAAALAYGAPGWPYFVMLGKDGTVKARGSGEVDSTELQRIVTAALAA